MDFVVEISTFEKFWGICSGHVGVSKNILWGQGSGLGPLWTIYNALEMI